MKKISKKKMKKTESKAKQLDPQKEPSYLQYLFSQIKNFQPNLTSSLHSNDAVLQRDDLNSQKKVETKLFVRKEEWKGFLKRPKQVGPLPVIPLAIISFDRFKNNITSDISGTKSIADDKREL